jgi:hypothetical protein
MDDADMRAVLALQLERVEGQTNEHAGGMARLDGSKMLQYLELVLCLAVAGLVHLEGDIFVLSVDGRSEVGSRWSGGGEVSNGH